MSAGRVIELLQRPKAIEQLRELHSDIMDQARQWVREALESPDENELSTDEQQRLRGFLAGTTHPALVDLVRESFAHERDSRRHFDHPDWDDMHSLFAKLVVEELGEPKIITVEDLADAFRAHMPVPEYLFDDVYPTFLGAVANAMHYTSRSAEIMPALPGLFVDIARHEAYRFAGLPVPGEENAAYDAWKGEKDFTLPLHLPNDVRMELTWQAESYKVEARVIGHITRSALDALMDVVVPLVKSVVSSVGFLHGLHHAKNYGVSTDPGTVAGERAFVQTCLEHFFAPQRAKSSLSQRIRNAVELLVEADRAVHHGLGLALSFGAIETLLCPSQEAISNTLGLHVPALLERGALPRSEAERFVKALYDKRSRFMHGGQLNVLPSDRRNARILAAGVLKAVIEARAYHSKCGAEAQTLEDLFKELKDAKWHADVLLPGVSESPARRLWRSGGPKHSR